MLRWVVAARLWEAARVVTVRAVGYWRVLGGRARSVRAAGAAQVAASQRLVLGWAVALWVVAVSWMVLWPARMGVWCRGLWAGYVR